MQQRPQQRSDKTNEGPQRLRKNEPAPAIVESYAPRPALTVGGVAASFGGSVADTVRNMDPVRRRRLGIVGAVVLLYLLVALHFTFHFFPNSNIGSVHVGGMDAGAAAEALGTATSNYQLQVEGENGVSFTVMSHEAALSLNSQEVANKALADNPGFLWPVMLLLPHDHSDLIVASADAGGFRAKVTDAVNWYNSKAEAPENAKVVYDEGEKAFKIQPEKMGGQLDEEKITQRITQALAAMEPVLRLGDEDYKRPAIYADDGRLQQSLEKAQQVLSTNAAFVANDQEVATLTGETAAKWVLSDQNGELSLDEEALNVWVQDVYDKSSTVGTTRTWKREDGKECTVSGGVYGWEANWLGIDEKVHDAIWAGTSGKIDVPMTQEADAYNGKNKRDWKAYIDVDLDEQHAVYYDENGKSIWEANFVSGAPDGKHNTPTGVYFVNNMQSPSVLIGENNASGNPEYETKVQYWMAWRDNDIGFHDANWQPSFGGTLFRDGAGSHGCINLSTDDAAALYKLVTVGTVVVCHGAENTSTSQSGQSSDSSGNSSSSSSAASNESQDGASSDAANSSDGGSGEAAADQQAGDGQAEGQAQ